MKPLTYLDNAASTPLRKEVIDVMHDCMQNVYGNPSSLHEQGRKAKVVIEQARRSTARLMGVTPSEVFFTSGGTEAINTILSRCVADLSRNCFITSRVEHPAVLKCLELLSKEANIEVHYLDNDAKGHISLSHLEERLSGTKDAVVVLMHANNEIGNLLPVKAVSELCKSHNALYFSDTVQTIGKYEVQLPNLGIDFAIASAHKFHGPKGAGFMVVRSAHLFKSLLRGGGQERNMRAGTENVYGIAGMAKALELAHEQMEADQKHISGLKQTCISLLRENIQDVQFNGDAEGSSLHTILNVSLPEGIDPNMIMPALDIEGICVSSGSACSSGSIKRSAVLEALHAEPGRPSVRVSFSRFNTAEEVVYFVKKLSAICQSS